MAIRKKMYITVIWTILNLIHHPSLLKRLSSLKVQELELEEILQNILLDQEYQKSKEKKLRLRLPKL